MKQRLFELVGLVLVLFGVFGLSSALTPTPPAVAGTQHNLSGWAWSANVGWISFNCTDTNTCGTADYGVNLDTISNDFSGFAWSDSVGWISFNSADLAGCPTAPCVAHMDPNTLQLSGWAKAITSANASWDGFIKLSGTSPNFGVVRDADGSGFTGFAWGGEVIGWMDWDPAGGGVLFGGSIVSPAVKLVIIDPPNTPVNTPVTVNIQALRADNTVDRAFHNKTVNLTGTGSVKIPHGTTDSDPTIGPVTLDHGSGVIQISNAVAENVILRLGATGHTAGLDITSMQTVNFFQGPQVTLTVVPNALAAASGNVTATWSVGNGGVSCTASASPQVNAPSWAGARGPASGTSGEQIAISGNVALTLTCLNSLAQQGADTENITVGTASDVDVTPENIPSVSLSVIDSLTAINQATGLNETRATIEWQTANVASCVGEEGDAAWRVEQPATFPQTLRYNTPALGAHTTYRITCVGTDPTLVATSVTTVFNGPAPQFTITANPSTIRVSFVSSKPEITTKSIIKVENTVGLSNPVAIRFATPQVANSLKSHFVRAGSAASQQTIRDNSSGAAYSLTGSTQWAEGADMRLVVPTRLSGGQYRNFKVEGRVDLGSGGVITKEIPITVIVQDFRPQFNER